MGRKNDAIVDFLGRDEVLADLYNGCLYNGEQVILPELLGDVQRTYHESLKNRYLKKRRRRRERDVLKLFQDKEHLILLAVEAQNNPHLCMPLKCLEYDVDEYVRQLRHLSRRYRENGELTEPTEKLSGIRRTDRLNPVVTIVLYHGEDDWTAPIHLQEMLDMSDMRPEMKSFCSDYNIHLFKLSDLNEKNFHTGLRELIGIMKRRNDKEAIRSYYEENRERFRQMDDATYDMLCAMTNCEKLLEKKQNHSDDGKEEKNDMIRAFQEIIADSKEEGRKEGIKEGLREGTKIGEERGEERGEKRGEKRGILQGEEKLSKLISQLLADQRTADVGKAVSSAGVRRRLYKEYGI